MSTSADFNPAHHPVMFMEPGFFSTVSAWVQHIPFAYLLIDLARPRVLAELGTHQGDSYFAFCQSVETLKLETKCFAIDTWQGDPQAGYYDQNVLNGVRSHSDAKYSTFSTLMQMTFDEAAAKFENGSIDLLHIDGLHTYEAVKHDFDTWRPKLSDRAVVLFHDTEPRNRPNFGVYRLWDELSAQFPAFEFPHGGGLGVVAVGANAPPPVKSFLDYANANAQTVRTMFNTIGRAIYAYQLILRSAEHQMNEYELLRQWRARTGQAPLQQITLGAVMHAPHELARFLCLEVQRAVGASSNVMR